MADPGTREAGWAVLTDEALPEWAHVRGHLRLTFSVHRDDDGFHVARCSELDVSAFSRRSAAEALRQLDDAVVTYLDSLDSTGERERVLSERGVDLLPGPPSREAGVDPQASRGGTATARSVGLVSA